MSLEGIVEQLSKQLGSSLSLNDFGVCRVYVNEKHRVSLETSIDEEHFFLYAHISAIQEPHQKRILAHALEGNLFGTETDGASIGYDAKSRALILFRRFLNEVEYTYFHREFQKFLGTLDLWKQNVEHWSEEAAEEMHYLDPGVKSILGSQKLKVYMV